jgi:drug/metabolite transporter (DMT)-like permease
MPSWIYYAAGTAVLLASADIMVKFAAGKLSNSIAMLLFGSATFLISTVWIILERLRGIPQVAQPVGMGVATAVGVTFTFVTLGLYTTFAAGAPISLASPTIRLGGLLLASLAGLLLFREPFTWRYAAGIALALSGIYLIITR